MVNAGRVAIVPQGEWSADATYKRLDAVTNNNTLYFAKKEVPAGTATTNTEYWSKSIVGGAGAIATIETAGIVKPDGTTITIDDDGTIRGQSEITVDGTTITLDEAKGIISLAKTLQDKIKTIDNKLPKTSVVNTNTTTEAGFALDARQANPNIAGTLAANILQLNNDLKSERFVETSELLNGCEGWLRYTVRNGICYANLWPIRSPNEAVNILVYDKMPKPAIYCGAFSNVLGNTIFAFIDAGTSNLKVHINAAAYTYVSFSYPVEL